MNHFNLLSVALAIFLTACVDNTPDTPEEINMFLESFNCDEIHTYKFKTTTLESRTRHYCSSKFEYNPAENPTSLF